MYNVFPPESLPVFPYFFIRAFLACPHSCLWLIFKEPCPALVSRLPLFANCSPSFFRSCSLRIPQTGFVFHSALISTACVPLFARSQVFFSLPTMKSLLNPVQIRIPIRCLPTFCAAFPGIASRDLNQTLGRFSSYSV